MESMNGIQPMYDLAGNNNEFGGGYWIWIILLFFLFGGNWGNNGNLQNDALMNCHFRKYIEAKKEYRKDNDEIDKQIYVL